MLKKVKTWVTIIVFLSLILLFVDSFLNRGAFAQKYGFSPQEVAAIFVISEIFFNLGIIIMLRASGIFKMTWKQIVNFQFKRVNFEFNLFFVGFIMNRAAAAVPWIYVLAVGWRRLPVAIVSLVVLELVMVAIITITGMELSKNGMQASKN